jgi:hypothetical protein
MGPAASAMIRVLIASGQFLAEVPTIEQGYPSSTLGGCGWTWEEKQRIVSICSDALYQVVGHCGLMMFKLTPQGWGMLASLERLSMLTKHSMV